MDPNKKSNVARAKVEVINHVKAYCGGLLLDSPVIALTFTLHSLYAKNRYASRYALRLSFSLQLALCKSV